jgi:hypothetical protein
MENLVNLDVNSVLSWLDVDAKDNSNWTKYVNKIENVSLKWNNLNITVITKRAFGDYLRWFFFFVLRCIVVALIPMYLISMFWFNFTDSFGYMKDNLKNKISSSIDWLNLESEPIFQQTKVVNDYVWLMDELLEN